MNTVTSNPGDWGRWLGLGAALAGVGFLPKDWHKGLAGAAAVALILGW